MTHEEKIAQWIGGGKIGVEIGAFKSPVPGLFPPPFYVDCLHEFATEKVHADYFGHAGLLPFRDNSLDYVISSHVLEHVANPVAAFAEWYRVLRPGGIIYLVVPDRRLTWDRPRPLTSVAHLLEDGARGTTQSDATHIDDFVYGVDWSLYHPEIPAAGVEDQRNMLARGMHQAVARGEEINIHFHTFEPSNVLELLDRLRTWPRPRFSWKIVDHAERFPANNPIGFLAIVRVDKSLRDHFAGWRNRRRTGRDPKFPLRPDALSFAAWIQTLPVPPPPPPAPFSLDEPGVDAVVDPLCISIRGWSWLEGAQSEISAIEATVGDGLLGETATLYARPDVIAVLGLPAGTRTAFEFFAHHPTAEPGGVFEIQISARLRDGTRLAIARRTVTAIVRDYRRGAYGSLLDRGMIAIHRQENIFARATSSLGGSPHLLDHVRRHLGPPPCRVIDVGCGMGYYGRALLAEGYDWLGVDIKSSDCAELARSGLPHRLVDGRTLPFDAGAFDAAICLEVLEYIDDVRMFIAEVHRIAPRQLIVSVPNCELFSYLADRLVIPWHMLQADHKNYFTRWSLGALLREYYPNVEVGFHTPIPMRTAENTPLYYHLLAVARG